MQSNLQQYFARAHEMARTSQMYYEDEASQALKKGLIRLGVAATLFFGVPVFAQNLPGYWKPSANAIASYVAAGFAVSASRPLKHRRRAKVSTIGIVTAEANGGEHAIRTAFERMPSEAFDTLSLTLPVDANIPTEDLAYSLAIATNSGTLIVAPSGCGKTMFLRRAGYLAYQHYQGKVNFYGIDCKGDEVGWLGLEQNGQRFVVMNSAQVPQGFNLLERIVEKLNSLTPEIPTIALLDEWNNGVSSATKFDKALPAAQRQNYASRMVLDGSEIVTKGRSKKVYGWMTTHTPNTDKIGMDSSTRQSVNMIILARDNKLGLITSILKGKFDFVDDEEVRDALLAQWMAFRQQNPNPEQPIALTNIGGPWRLVQLPDYRQPLPNVLGGQPANQDAFALPQTSALPVKSFTSGFDPDEEWEDEDELEDVFEEVDTIDRTSTASPTSHPLPLPKFWAIQNQIHSEERNAVVDLYYRQGQINKGIIARTVWNITPGGGVSWEKGAKPKIDRILAEYTASLERSLHQTSNTDPFNNLPTDTDKDEQIYRQYRQHRLEHKGVTEFVESVWGVKKPSPEFQQARSELFQIIQTRLKEWVAECLARNPKPGKETIVYEIWRMENKSTHVWKDANRQLNFRDLRNLVSEAVEAIEQEQSESEEDSEDDTE